jgi:type II secretory pathway pseudopilin PulG
MKFWTFSRKRGEAGFALASVMAVTAVLIILASAAVAYGVGSQHISRHDQDWNAALSAAEAGIDDYIFRLNENSNYWLYNAGNLPSDGNQAFTSWVDVAGGTTASQYRYDINASTITTNGVIKITSTGRVNDTKRTVYASLRRRSFIDYLYFTDYETKDPASYTGSPFTAAEAQTRCSKYYYGGSNVQRDVNGRVDYPGDSDSGGEYCTDINFVSGDTINGPLHSNDAYLVCGTPTFNGETSTSWDDPSGNRYRTNGSCSNDPNFANAGDPRLLSPLTLPPSNSAIKAETLAGRGGCLYTGPTRIKLNNNGTMTIKSPFSKQTNNSPCPTNGTGALPSNGVVYVQNVPSVASDPNYTNGCPYSVSGRAHPLGMPIASDISTYGCRNGDVFIEGTLDGQLTVAAENNIDITWNLTYKNGVGGDDLLGLVANNYVEVYHPVQCTSGNSSSCNLNANFPNETARNAKFQNPTIQAAILSVNHSFWVQNYSIGAASALGTLHIDGAIAQRYRGPVGTTSGGSPNTGYVKQYVYDQRLKYLSPPKFLDPVASSWGVATWAENKVPAAYQ